MASFPQFYSELNYPNNFTNIQCIMMDGSSIKNNNMELGVEENLIPSFELCAMDQIVSSDQSDPLSSLLTMPFPPDRYGFVSDMTVPSLPEINMGSYGIQSFVGGQQSMAMAKPAAACEFREDLYGFVPELKPLYCDSGDSWGNKSNEMHGVVEETNIKVASRYSEEERKERILRYLKKRNQRNFNKTIKYACRKTLADRRTRVRGRFARNNEQMTSEILMDDLKTNPNNHILKPSEFSHHHFRDAFQSKEEEERWLQELAGSLMYMPYVTNYSGLSV